MSKNAIVLGCGRSGTSIFGELFEELPLYTYLSEPPVDSIFDMKEVSHLAVKVPRQSSVWPSDPGLSIPLDRLAAHMAQPQIYWIVRHPLDTICSLRVGISRNWGHHPRPPDWKDWLGRAWYEQCAHHWTYLNQVGYATVREKARVVYFADLIADPLTFAQTICDDLGVKIATASLRWVDRVQDSNNEKFVEAQTSRAYSTSDHKKRVGRWRENMSQEEASRAWEIVREVAHGFGFSWGP